MTSRYLRDIYNPLNYKPSRKPLGSLITNEPYLENLKRQITFHSESLIQSLDDLQDLQLQNQLSRHSIFPAAQPYNSRLVDPSECNNWKLPRVGTEPNNSRVMDPSKFQLEVDVKHFKEDEVDVRIEDGFVVITAKHEEHADECGFVSRSITRRYMLPENVESDKVTSFLSGDGVLTIKAPRKVGLPLAFEKGRIVSIEME